MIKINGTIYATLQATCGVSPRERTNESKIAGMTKLGAGQYTHREGKAVTFDILSNATAGVAPTTGESIRSSDYILVEETRAPHLTRNECTTEYADEETEGYQSLGAGDETSKGGWNCSAKKNSGEDVAGSETVA